MKQNFNSQELIKYLKKGELIRNELEKEDVEAEIDILEEQILNESAGENNGDAADGYLSRRRRRICNSY